MDPKSPSKVKTSIARFAHYTLALKIGAVIVLAGLLLLSGLHLGWKRVVSHDPGRSYFMVIVDCGSTGTRVNVYEWMLRAANEWELPILVNSYPDNLIENRTSNSSCQYHCLQTKPGLDRFIGNASGVRAALEPLITWAKQWVPEERHPETPIFVLATAGLRRLAVKDVTRVLNDVEAVVKEHAFVYKRSWIRVLHGKEEAYYGWLALNYKMGRLGNHSRSPTLGLLDVGGSSLQVAMEVHDTVNHEQLVRLTVGAVEHWVLAYSFPAFGLQEAFDRTLVILTQNETPRQRNGNYILSHPCLNPNYVQNYACYNCRTMNTPEEIFLGSAKQKAEFSIVNVVGDPNWEECRILARAAAANSSYLKHSSVAVGTNRKENVFYHNGDEWQNIMGVAQPDLAFHALSGFFAVYSKLRLGNRANFTRLLEKGHQLCSKSWINSSHITEHGNYGGQFCFQVPYLASLIDEALHVGNRDIIVGPGDISWPLGASLVEGKFMQSRPFKANTALSSFRIRTVGSIPSPVFLFVLLICLGAFVYRRQIKLPMLQKNGAAGVSLPLCNPRRQRSQLF
ncbi:probable apyrase 7 isoform X1 [Rhodamnia argentea]|uniref:apyrase n=1 Tax=Rhodamnia argentea TaxID=178133 RepID=A0ABM3HIE5_9MYRT|nr:probable apyrase 7 isoform X1 [Rhodamnia argentea]